MSPADNAPAKMIPDPDGLNADFYRHLAGGSLCLQHCAACERTQHPPRYLCPACGSSDLEWLKSSGKGRVFSWTLNHRPVDPGWAAEALPWAIVVAEMEEGIRLVGGLRGMDPGELRLDLPVRVEIEKASDEFAFIYFSPDLNPDTNR